MSVAVSVSQLCLASLFAIAGAAKLADLSSTRRAVAELGGLVKLTGAVAIALPLAELAIVAALLLPSSARVGAFGALGLLLIFCAVIARALARGSAPDCNCFGGLTQTRVGRGTLLRNGALTALAAFAALAAPGEDTGAFAWLGDLAADDRAFVLVIVALSLAVVGLAWFSWQVLRQNGRLLERLDAQAGELSAGGPGLDIAVPEPLEPGAPAPPFATEDFDGEPISLDSLLAPGFPLVLLFTDPDCGACEVALTEAKDAQWHRGEELTVAIVSRGDEGRMRTKAEELTLEHVVHDADGSLFEAFRMLAVPSAQGVDSDGRMATDRAVGRDAVRRLIAGTRVAALTSEVAQQ